MGNHASSEVKKEETTSNRSSAIEVDSSSSDDVFSDSESCPASDDKDSCSEHRHDDSKNFIQTKMEMFPARIKSNNDSDDDDDQFLDHVESGNRIKTKKEILPVPTLSTSNEVIPSNIKSSNNSSFDTTDIKEEDDGNDDALYFIGDQNHVTERVQSGVWNKTKKEELPLTVSSGEQKVKAECIRSNDVDHNNDDHDKKSAVELVTSCRSNATIKRMKREEPDLNSNQKACENNDKKRKLKSTIKSEIDCLIPKRARRDCSKKVGSRSTEKMAAKKKSAVNAELGTSHLDDKKYKNTSDASSQYENGECPSHKKERNNLAAGANDQSFSNGYSSDSVISEETGSLYCQDDVSDGSDEDAANLSPPQQNQNFPHVRENCVVYPFQTDRTSATNMHYCASCICYICRESPSVCKSWPVHCHAMHNDLKCKREAEHRAAAVFYRQQQRQTESRNANGENRKKNSTSNAAREGETVRSQIHPYQRPVPTIDLVDYENGTEAVDAASSFPDPPDFSVQGLLEEVTGVYPVEMIPPSPPFTSTTTNLFHYQKQSLAFMYDIEVAPEAPFERMPQPYRRRKKPYVRGGWLASEEGMGKTATVLALVASNPPRPDQIATWEALIERMNSEVLVIVDAKTRLPLVKQSIKRKPLKLKATIVITSNRLLGQWEDECALRCPTLRVERYHPPSKEANTLNFEALTMNNDIVCAERFAHADVVLTTATVSWPTRIIENCQFHRVIMDEAHTLGKTSAASLKKANSFDSLKRWCVTATPVTSSLNDLEKQAGFLGFMSEPAFEQPLRVCKKAIEAKKLSEYLGWDAKRRNQEFYEFRNVLRVVMIRHVHSQRINGCDAQTLPPMSMSDIELEMTKWERKYYYLVLRDAGVQKALKKYSTQALGCKVVDMETTLQRLSFPSGHSEQRKKVSTLAKMIGNLVNESLAVPDNSVRKPIKAVVITKSSDLLRECVKAIRGIGRGIRIFQADTSSSASNWDKSIREFQLQAQTKHAVFVMAWKKRAGTGVIGITLTEASNVFLMEPWLDPSIEMQAVARIFRVGQTGSVKVRRFIYRNTHEDNIRKLHEQIRQGLLSLRDDRISHEGGKIITQNLLDR